jgi:hypothetical protein
VPPVRQRMLEMQRTLMVNQPTAVPFDRGALIYVTVGFATILTAVGIYFLIRNRPAFVRADS